MQSFIVIFLVFLFIGSVQSQNWLGTYTPDPSCSTASCCCISGQVVVTTASAGFSSFTTGLSGGILCGFATAYTTNMSTPSGYIATLMISVITLTFTLDSSSSFINVSSTQNSAPCNSFLTKNTAVTETAASKSLGLMSTMPPSKKGLLYLMTFIGLMKSVW
jgi:hypothetical protein